MREVVTNRAGIAPSVRLKWTSATDPPGGYPPLLAGQFAGQIPAKYSRSLPQGREGGPQLLNEQVGLFKGGKVTTPIKLIPVDQV
jgi:hypothetical protein